MRDPRLGESPGVSVAARQYVDLGFLCGRGEEAITRNGLREIFNTDQGCQFTSQEFTGLLQAHDIQINMDGDGWWRDNVFVERL